jgi:ElaA protein
MTTLAWQWQQLPHMTSLQIFQVLHLRAKIFVVEQQDAYLDPDEIDLHAWHVQAYQQDQLISYGRVYLDAEGRVKIGRIVVAQECRGQGIAQQLMTEILRFIGQHEAYKSLNLILNAQHHLEHFYEQFGFQACSEPYLVGPIMHIDMQRPALS